MLTLYQIALATVTEEGEPTLKCSYEIGPEEVEAYLVKNMIAGDQALIYQIDACSPRSAEEAVRWLNGDPRLSLQVLVGEAKRESDDGPPTIVPIEVRGYMYAPQVEIQA